MGKSVLSVKISNIIFVAALLFGAICEVRSQSLTFTETSNYAALSRTKHAKDIEEFRRVNEILQELEAMRANFLHKGDFIDIFPTVYYQVTLRELEYLKSDKFKNTQEITNLIINFYEIYKNNRQAYFQNGITAVEPQWRDYYQQAALANNYRQKSANPLKSLILLSKVKQILQSGFSGHIIFDLPCAVNRSLDSAASDKASVYRDFRLSDEIMKSAAVAANRDISQTLFSNNRIFARLILNLGARFIFLQHKINRLRAEAWKEGSKIENKFNNGGTPCRANR